MPIQRCKSHGKPGYKWGSKGTCYTYTKGNKEQQSKALAKAAAQGKASKEREMANEVS